MPYHWGPHRKAMRQFKMGEGERRTVGRNLCCGFCEKEWGKQT